MTFLDFNMLKTLPEGQVRNGFAELMKISSCADKRIWELLVGHGEELIDTRFGRLPGSDPKLKKIADEICWRGIKVMLDVRYFSLHHSRFVFTHIYPHSSRARIYTRLVWTVSLPSGIHLAPLWNLHPLFLSDMDMLWVRLDCHTIIILTMTFSP